MSRIAITGPPRTGKSMLALALSDDARSTDAFRELGWSEQSAAASEWFDEPGDLVVEGVAVPRALRKWLAANPEGRPVDEIHFLDQPFEKLSDGQRRMGKGVRTVLAEIADELRERGVEIHGL